MSASAGDRTRRDPDGAPRHVLGRAVGKHAEVPRSKAEEHAAEERTIGVGREVGAHEGAERHRLREAPFRNGPAVEGGTRARGVREGDRAVHVDAERARNLRATGEVRVGRRKRIERDRVDGNRHDVRDGIRRPQVGVDEREDRTAVREQRMGIEQRMGTRKVDLADAARARSCTGQACRYPKRIGFAPSNARSSTTPKSELRYSSVSASKHPAGAVDHRPSPGKTQVPEVVPRPAPPRRSVPSAPESS